ncbi:MAG: hypothetical protein KF781_00155 [Chitinophagaceae bacterium]|nr:hypothetical protein [Chitinophagaceae bacterium]MCW5905145.1 hypothetical protein [Chitinophagaceae bacterium]
MNIKLLKGINYLSIAITVALTIFFLINLFDNTSYRNDERFLRMIPYLIIQPLLLIFSLIISIKTHQQKGVMLFALFLSLLSMNYVLQYLRMVNTDWMSFVWIVISYALTATVHIKSLQSFPRQITKQDVKAIFPKNKILYEYTNWSIKNYIWIVFPVIVAVAASLGINDSLIDTFIMFTALLGLYVNYKKSSPSERNKILWLFWGLMTYTFLFILHLILQYITKENPFISRLIFGSVINIVLVFSLLMSLFFSDAFDTGVLIRRTLVDGFFFILIVLIYNTVEHYFLHWLSHELELSDVLLSSLLSGAFVLAFSPLHHKLMNFLKKKMKKNIVEHTENEV